MKQNQILLNSAARPIPTKTLELIFAKPKEDEDD